jgi:hypothetical protein
MKVIQTQNICNNIFGEWTHLTFEGCHTFESTVIEMIITNADDAPACRTIFLWDHNSFLTNKGQRFLPECPISFIVHTLLYQYWAHSEFIFQKCSINFAIQIDHMFQVTLTYYQQTI